MISKLDGRYTIVNEAKNMKKRLPYYLHPWVWGPLYLFAGLFRTLLAFSFFSSFEEALLSKKMLPRILTCLQRFERVSRLIFVWYGLAPLVNWFTNKSWFQEISSYSFIIFVVHVPLLTFCMDAYIRFLAQWKAYLPAYQSICFFTLPLFITTICILVGACLKGYALPFYRIITGGRGM